MVSAIYKTDNGIHPWRAIKQIINEDYLTFTIVCNSKSKLLDTLVPIFSVLGEFFEKMFRWHTIRFPFNGNKIQEIKLKKELGAEIPGFKSMFLKESPIKGIWCNSTEIVLPFKKNHFDYMVSDGRTILVMVPYRNINSEEAWDELSCNPKGYEALETANYINDHPDVILAMFYEDDISLAVQFFGKFRVIKNVTDNFTEINMKKVKSQKEIADFISSG